MNDLAEKFERVCIKQLSIKYITLKIMSICVINMSKKLNSLAFELHVMLYNSTSSSLSIPPLKWIGMILSKGLFFIHCHFPCCLLLHICANNSVKLLHASGFVHCHLCVNLEWCLDTICKCYLPQLTGKMLHYFFHTDFTFLLYNCNFE